MEYDVKNVFKCCAANGRFIFGCGVVSYGTKPENLLVLRKIVESFDPYK